MKENEMQKTQECAEWAKRCKEQKQRLNAIDMIKHLAAAWDIDAEEIFGIGGE